MPRMVYHILGGGGEGGDGDLRLKSAWLRALSYHCQGVWHLTGNFPMCGEDEGRLLPLASGLAIGSFQPSIHALDSASLAVGSSRKIQTVPSP